MTGPIKIRFKKLLSVLFSLLIALLIFELFFTLLYYILDDGRYVPAAVKIEQSSPKGYRISRAQTCFGKRSLSPHPWLGYSRLTKPFCDSYEVGGSHTGEVFPFTKDPDKFTILFTGASVPKQLLDTIKPSIRKQLSENYHYQGKEIVVLGGAVEGWKQPQQTIMLLLSLGVIDAVFTVEGFNELVFTQNKDFHYHYQVPYYHLYRKANTSILTNGQRNLIWITESLYDSVEKGHVLKHSKIVYFILNTLRRSTREALANSTENPMFQQTMGPFVLPDHWTLEQRRAHFMENYLQSVKTMHTIANANNLKFAYFLQPAPVIGKTLTESEQNKLRDTSYKDDYLAMEQQLLALQAEGLEVYSLTHVFENFSGEAYKDSIHIHPESGAAEVLNNAIIETLVERWGLEPVSSTARTINNPENSE